MFKINGYELEYDFLDVDDREFFEEEFKKANEFIQNAYANANEGNASAFMRDACEAIVDFIDNLFGEGTSNKIFEGKTNYKKCFLAITELVKEVKKQDAEMSELAKEVTGSFLDDIKEVSPNREQRRLNKKLKN